MKRQRAERGILGVKKDPKNQILFSFQARKGDEWPSDSDDSDYLPSDEDVKVKKKKTERDKEDKEPKRKVESSTVPQKSPSKTCSHLPPELWTRILLEVIHTQGALPFLCRAAKVCRLWRDIVSQPEFWKKIDLSFGWIKSNESTLRWLVRNRLGLCESLNLQSWGNLTDSMLQEVADGCAELVSVNMSYCKKLAINGMKSLINACKLSDVNLSFSNVSMPVIKHLLEIRGTYLRKLNISGSSWTGTVLDLIVTNCPNLELLDLSNCAFSSEFVAIDVCKFQGGCPKLKVLNMGNSKFKLKHGVNVDIEDDRGFPELEELSFGSLKPSCSTHISTDLLNLIIKHSTKLRLVDLRGCESLHTDILPCLASSSDVEELYLSNSFIKRYPENLTQILQTWCHSLRVIDVSKNKFHTDSLDVSLQNFLNGINTENVNFEQVNLQSTDVNEKTIRLLIKKCPKLNYINLCSCYGLPRGVKKEHRGRDVKKLLKLLTS